MRVMSEVKAQWQGQEAIPLPLSLYQRQNSKQDEK